MTQTYTSCSHQLHLSKGQDPKQCKQTTNKKTMTKEKLQHNPIIKTPNTKLKHQKQLHQQFTC